MLVLLLVVVPLVVALYALIASMNHGDHYAPQAYYRRKRGGAPIAYGYESLAPRHRRRSAEELRYGGEPPAPAGGAASGGAGPTPPPRESAGARRPCA